MAFEHYRADVSRNKWLSRGSFAPIFSRVPQIIFHLEIEPLLRDVAEDV
jgi:hypothetical protein